MSEAYAQVELRIKDAVDVINNNKMTIGELNKALSDVQEFAVCEYLDLLDKGSHKARYFMVKKGANQKLREPHTSLGPPPTVSAIYPVRFLVQHPEYKIDKQKALAGEYMNTQNKELYTRTFSSFQNGS